MGGLNLGTTTAVDELQPGDGAALVIGAQHNTTEHPIPDHARDQRRDPLAGFVEDEGRAILPDGGRLIDVVGARQQRVVSSSPAETMRLKSAGDSDRTAA